MPYSLVDNHQSFFEIIKKSVSEKKAILHLSKISNCAFISLPCFSQKWVRINNRPKILFFNPWYQNPMEIFSQFHISRPPSGSLTTILNLMSAASLQDYQSNFNLTLQKLLSSNYPSVACVGTYVLPTEPKYLQHSAVYYHSQQVKTIGMQQGILNRSVISLSPLWQHQAIG